MTFYLLIHLVDPNQPIQPFFILGEIDRNFFPSSDSGPLLYYLYMYILIADILMPMNLFGINSYYENNASPW